MLPNNDYEDDDGDVDGNRFINTMNSSEQLHFPISSNSTILHATLVKAQIFFFFFLKSILFTENKMDTTKTHLFI